MKILWDERAWEEYLEWQTQDKKTLKRINMLIKDIQSENADLPILVTLFGISILVKDLQ